MSICLVALVVFAVLGLFSAKYRRWAREAFSCVGRRLTLRPCDTGFNERLKAKLTSRLMGRSQRIARFAHRHFEPISWVFTIVLFVSLAYTAFGMHNLAVYGTCDPVTGNCIFNPENPNRAICPFEGIDTANGVETIGGFYDVPDASINGKPLVYFIGASGCPYCRWEKPVFTKSAEKFGDFITTRIVEIDKEKTEEDLKVFAQYSPEGKIPVIIIGGKYYRIGSGESFGEEGEEMMLTAFFCKITNNAIGECNAAAIRNIVENI